MGAVGLSKNLRELPKRLQGVFLRNWLSRQCPSVNDNDATGVLRELKNVKKLH